MNKHTRHDRKPVRRGFTLVEMLIAMVIAMVVITSAMAFTVSTYEGRRHWTLRESVDRDARFIGMSLARDAQEAGIAMESTPVFASVDASGDTLSILSVPYDPNEAPVYPIWNDGDTAVNYPPDGNCGYYCVKFNRVNGEYRLKPGDIARLQVGTERRLVYLTSVGGDGPGQFRINILPRDRMLGRQAGLSDSILLSRSGTSLQQLQAVVYWRDAGTETLWRATSFDGAGNPIGQMIAANVEAFQVRLQFLDGVERPRYDGFDNDTLNDGNRIIGVRVEATLRSDRTDPAVNNGQPVRRTYQWKIAPRNLLYEKNR